MNKLIYCFIIIALLFTGCSNQYSGLGFPYSMKNKQAKIDEITIPEEGQDVIKATEEILNASIEKIPLLLLLVMQLFQLNLVKMLHKND